MIQNQRTGTVHRLVHIGCADEDRNFSFYGKMFQELPEFPPRERIDTDRRLVEQNQFRVGNQCAGERKLLLHAAGKTSRKAFREFCQIGHFKQSTESFTPDFCGNGAHFRAETHVFHDGQVFIEPEFLRHVADG